MHSWLRNNIVLIIMLIFVASLYVAMRAFCDCKDSSAPSRMVNGKHDDGCH